MSAKEVQPKSDRSAQNLEAMSSSFTAYQNAAHGIYDEHRLIIGIIQFNPIKILVRLAVFRNDLKIRCQPVV